MASANHPAPGVATPPTPPATVPPSKAQILTDVFSLATTFATCVEAFNLILPHKDSNHAQKVALAKLGIQQGRLLIFGDVVGISSPPRTIARHMVPSHPGLTNPDPTLPVNFGLRDARLDEDGIRQKVQAALDEIAGRPRDLTREQLMERYGLKQPRRFSSIEHPALDTNRLEAFREKYALLQDLVRQNGIRAPARRTGSMALNNWTVKDVSRFEGFVRTVRVEVDGLIALLGVKEQVDRAMRTDIKAMAWHPDLSSVMVRQDWTKLRLIREAVAQDYPEYVQVADRALKYITDEVRDSKIGTMMAVIPPSSVEQVGNSDGKGGTRVSESAVKTPGKEKRPSFWSIFSYKGPKEQKQRSRSIVSNPEEERNRPPSESELGVSNTLEPVRAKSLSALPDEPAPLNLDARLRSLSMQDESALNANADSTLVQVPSHYTSTTVGDDDDVDPLDTSHSNGLVHADTANSLVDRHDMYKGMGRIETKDIRDKSKEAAGQ